MDPTTSALIPQPSLPAQSPMLRTEHPRGYAVTHRGQHGLGSDAGVRSSPPPQSADVAPCPECKVAVCLYRPPRGDSAYVKAVFYGTAHPGPQGPCQVSKLAALPTSSNGLGQGYALVTPLHCTLPNGSLASTSPSTARSANITCHVTPKPSAAW